MNNPWKLATIAIAIAGAAALTTAFTTAQMVRSSTSSVADIAPAVPRPAVAYAVEPVPRATSAARPAVARPAATPRATPVSAPAPAADDCASGTDRAMRIAKPGVVGTLIGAGLGAAGGAVADGGKGAGKGAIIGGLAGAALGTGYGAYKTKNECGTIFGTGSFQDGPADVSAPTVAPAAATQAGGTDDRLRVYHAQ